MKTFIQYAAFLLLISLRLNAGVLEDAAASLGDDSFQRRDQADAQLRKVGPEALPVIEPLLHSDDPEIARRAQRIYDWISCGIDERMPAELAADLPRFDTIPAERQHAVVKGLEELDPPHLTGLICLHSRLFAMPLSEEIRNPILALVETGIKKAAPPRELAMFSPWPLDVRTRALLINLAASGKQAKDLKETFLSWQKMSPELSIYLDRAAIGLEVERLRLDWDKRGALSLISQIRDEGAFQELVVQFREWMLGDPTLDITALGEPEAIGLLELVFESTTPGDAIPLIRKLRDSTPDLDRKTRPSRAALMQALGLWDAGKHAEAASALCGKGNEIRNGAEFLAQMITGVEVVDIEGIGGSITPKGGEKLLGIFLREPISEAALAHALSLSTTLRARGGLTRESAFAGKAGMDLALDLWKRNRDDLCYRVMEEAFWGMDGGSDWELSFFPAVAFGMGRLEDALVTAAKVTTDDQSRSLKMAYLYRAAGRQAEALAFSEKSPDSDVHELLLIELGNWLTLSQLSKGPASDWFAFLNGDRENWRGKVPEPGNKPALLRLMLDEHPSLFSESFGIGRDEVHAGHHGRLLAGDAIVSGMLHDRIGEALKAGKPARSQDLKCYFGYPDMIPDREDAAELLGRLSGKPSPPATIEGIRTAFASSRPESLIPFDPPQGISGDILRIPHPMIGFSGDPRAVRLDLLNGLSEAQELYDNGDKPGASKHAVELAIRMALDRTIRDTSYGIAGGGHVSGVEMVMRGCMVRDTPRELALPAAKVLSLLTRGWQGNEETARLFAQHGEYGQAIQMYHRHCAAKLNDRFTHRKIEEAGYLVELWIRHALSMSHPEEAVEIYIRHHRLIPYDFRVRDDLLDELRKAGETSSIRKLDEVVTRFWEDKLKSLPDAALYRQALERWRKTVDEP